MAICLRVNTIAIVVDERFLLGIMVMLSKVLPFPYSRVYKSGLLGINDIDLLCSEFPVLNI
jgi:hypothetical protein